MGRRKKEPAWVHRAAIAKAAEQIFMKKGLEAATVDDIAKAAGYSKATLYVYFRNKEEIIGLLVLESMKKLQACVDLALKDHTGARTRYDAICQALRQYQEEYPFYFQIALGGINTDLEREDTLPVEREIFQIGEQINQSLVCFLQDGISSGELRSGIPLMPTVFSFWAMLSGLVEMAASKESYIERHLKLSKQSFLQYGFDTLYHSISI